MTDYQSFSGRDFTAKFEAVLAQLLTEVPELTDFNHSDAGISLLRLLEDETDKANFYIDRAFLESFINSARFMQSLINIGASTDWPPKLASAAVSTVRVTRLPSATADIDIPQFSVFKRSDGISYVSTAAMTLPAGQDYVDISVVQGAVNTITLQPSDFTVLDLSKRPKYNLGQNVAAGSATMVDTTFGINWTLVDSFWRSLSSDTHFMLELRADKYNGVMNTVFLVLGDGVNGAPLSNPVSVSFLVCDGSTGNSGINTITVPPNGMENLFTCSNATVANGGASAETSDNYRKRLPLVTRTQRRGVSTDDYQALIESIPGVTQCQADDRNTDQAWPHFYIALYVVPEGGGPLSDSLAAQIANQCSAWGHLGPWSAGRYILRSATQVPVNISCRFGLSAGYVAGAVITAVTSAISALFDPDSMGIGETLDFSNMNIAGGKVPGVSWIEFDSPQADVMCGEGQVFVAGTITITQQP